MGINRGRKSQNQKTNLPPSQRYKQQKNYGGRSAPPPPPPSKTPLFIGAGLILLVAVGVFFVYRQMNSADNNSLERSVTVHLDTSVTSEPISREELIGQMLKSIVEIRPNVLFQHIQGSGIIVDPRGYILTAAHVVGDALDASINVALENGDRAVYEAEVIGVDVCHDIALLRVSENVRYNRPEPLSIRETSVGSQVYSLGYYMNDRLGNQPDPALTEGIVSRFLSYKHHSDMVEHRAYVNSGSSGGPLVTQSGQLAGINVMRVGDVYLAVNAPTVAQVYESLLNGSSPVGLRQLNLDETVTASIDSVDHMHCYLINHSSAQNMRITVDATDREALDPMIQLYSGNRLIAEADDIAPPDNLNAELKFLAQANQDYVVVVRSTHYRSGGEYSLNLAIESDGLNP